MIRARQSEIVDAAAGQVRLLKVWLVLLCLAELADLVTTRADRLHGGIEANQVAAFTLGVGGPGFFWVLKLGLVLAMAGTVLLAVRLSRGLSAGRAGIVQRYIARSLQLCVLILTVAAIANLGVLA